MNRYVVEGRDLWVLLGPVAIMFGAELFVIWFASVGVAVPNTCCDLNPLAMNEAAARLQVVIFLVAFAIAAAATCAKVGWDMVREFRWRLDHLLLVLALAAVAGVAVVILMQVGWWPETKTLVGSQMFDKAFAVSATLSSPSVWTESNLAAIVEVYGIVVLVAGALLATGMAVCVAVPRGFDDLSPEVQKHIWYTQSDRMKLYLYLGAGTLALGVLFMRAWTAYPVFIVEGDAYKDVRAAFIGVVNSYVGYVGLYFTAMLASVALPVMTRLSSRATGIASQIARLDPHSGLKEPPPADRFNLIVQTTKESQRLALTRDGMLQAVVSVLAPVLVGALPGLIHLVV